MACRYGGEAERLNLARQVRKTRPDLMHTLLSYRFGPNVIVFAIVVLPGRKSGARNCSFPIPPTPDWPCQVHGSACPNPNHIAVICSLAWTAQSLEKEALAFEARLNSARADLQRADHVRDSLDRLREQDEVKLRRAPYSSGLYAVGWKQITFLRSRASIEPWGANATIIKSRANDLIS